MIFCTIYTPVLVLISKSVIFVSFSLIAKHANRNIFFFATSYLNALTDELLVLDLGVVVEAQVVDALQDLHQALLVH